LAPCRFSSPSIFRLLQQNRLLSDPRSAAKTEGDPCSLGTAAAIGSGRRRIKNATEGSYRGVWERCVTIQRAAGAIAVPVVGFLHNDV
jgi:hypothetical protein